MNVRCARAFALLALRALGRALGTGGRNRPCCVLGLTNNQEILTLKPMKMQTITLKRLSLSAVAMLCFSLACFAQSVPSQSVPSIEMPPTCGQSAERVNSANEAYYYYVTGSHNRTTGAPSP